MKKLFTFFIAVVFLFAGALSSFAAPPVASYTGLKPLIKPNNANKNYLKNENLLIVLKYINEHYFHGKYPLVRLNDGELLFPYGIVTPTVFLRVRRLTLIKFPHKTQILSVTAGNSQDFKFKKISNLTGDYLTLKSTHSMLRTTMVVTTTDRLYYFNIVSTKHRYMPIVGFYFPGIYVKNYNVVSSSQRRNVAAAGISLNDINFKYYVTGTGYKVLRVFNDGKETFIKLADTGNKSLPAIFIKRNKQNYLVNFIYRGGYYVLRGIPKTIILISRTKSSKKEITIHRGAKPSPWWGKW